ncbi:MAG: hypothetical protein AAF539_12300, partial [Planctomycetota bacterium]
SASMRRGDLWQQAKSMAGEVLDDLSPQDRWMVMTFDESSRTLGSNIAVSDSPDRSVAMTSSTETQAEVLAQLNDTQPSWRSTDFNRAFDDTIEHVRELSAGGSASANEIDVATPSDGGVVVWISDLQSGGGDDAIRSLAWPDDVRVDFRSLDLADSDNVSLRFMKPDQSFVRDDLAVQLHRHGGTDPKRFEVTWHNLDEATQAITVPPRQVQTLRLPWPETDETDQVTSTNPMNSNGASSVAGQCVIVSGDEHVFDNERYIVPPQPETKTLLHVGTSNDDPRQSLTFYLARLPLDRGFINVEFETVATLTDSPIDVTETPMVVLSKVVSDSEFQQLGQFVRRGGTLLAVLSEDEPSAWQLGLSSLIDGPLGLELGREISNVPRRFGSVDLNDPLLASFRQPLFADFSKIQFWRTVPVMNPSPQWHTTATFDNGSIAIARRRVGEGQLWIVASGWQPEQSELALSTKFVPMMNEWFWTSVKDRGKTHHLNVGQRLTLDEWNDDDWKDATLVGPNNTRVATSPDQIASQLDRPGIYEVETSKRSHRFAVNLDSQESQLEPIPIDQWEQWGVPTGSLASAADIRESQHQLQRRELEHRQGLWRWALLCVSVFLCFETWLAGRRRSQSRSSVGVATA